MPENTDNPTGGLIQSPDLPESGKPKDKSIKDIPMAKEVVKTLISANRNRQIINSRIIAKYNSERPYDQSKLEAEGLGWRQNFTTKPLPQIVEKIYPRFVEAVNGLKYITNASLSSKWTNATVKTEAFRSGITKLVRGKKGWRNLLEDIALENALFGYAVAARLDESGWFPKVFKQDESFLSDGTKQCAANVQVIALKETVLPHELFAQIKDREAADGAGFNIENSIQVINKASPSQVRDSISGNSTDTWYQNAQRELTLGSSYMAGSTVIVTYHLLAREVTGKVSHYRLAGEDLMEIFSRDDRFDSMESALSFFAFQKGNGTMHSSKGIGREIYELAGMIDRIRNEVVDRSILSGKTLVQGDLRQLHKFKMSVVGATCIIPQEWKVLEQRIDGNTEPFLRLDAFFGTVADQLVGNVSPPQAAGQGEAFRSPQAWQLLAAREEEGKDTRIARFLEFFVEMVGTMTKRICSPDVDEKDAKAFRKEMLELMTKEELDELADQPVAGTIRDLTNFERQMIASIATEKRGNPFYNARQLEIEDMTARVDSEFANKVLLPEADPTEQAEQSRLQMLELSLLTQGQSVPVSPRDNHEIHLGMLMPVAEQIGGALNQGQTGTAVFEAVVAHIAEHYNQAVGAGSDKKALKPVKEFIDGAAKAIAELKKLDTEAESLGAESQAHDAEALPA